MFSEQHYIAIANIIKDLRQPNPTQPGYTVVDTRSLTARLADLFKNDNPLFDRNKFIKACGIG